MLALALLFAQATAPLPLEERLRQEALAAAELQVQGVEGYRFKVVSVSPLPPHAGPAARLELSHLSKREPTGRFFVAYRLVQEGRLIGTARVDLEGLWQGHLLMARTSLPRKAVPDPGSLEPTPFEGTPPPGALRAWPEGHRLRQPVNAGKVLTQSDLEPIPLVSQGERVRVTLTCGVLSITAEGVARTQGAKGDRVRVELPSRKVLQASVCGQGEAEVVWQETR